jgi:RNA polymerase sigma factor (sigma-70 family)
MIKRFAMEMHQDAALLQGYRDGQAWAFEKLYRGHTVAVERFLQGGFTFVSRGRTCRYRGGNAGVDIDAIVQETFTRAFSASTRAHYDGERPFKNYLLSIAKNLVLRELARHERHASLDSMEDASDLVFARARAGGAASLLPDERSPEKTTADVELQEITRAFIATLDDEERAFFTNRFARGLTQEATAEEMGCTRARVKLLEKRLREAFLACLRGRGYFVDHDMKPRWSRKAA